MYDPYFQGIKPADLDRTKVIECHRDLSQEVIRGYSLGQLAGDDFSSGEVLQLMGILVAHTPERLSKALFSGMKKVVDATSLKVAPEHGGAVVIVAYDGERHAEQVVVSLLFL